MSYQVLARKWRPKRFAELVGQEHVKSTLINALQMGRLHHAYLFTGTRGVGKTTIARIFAKSLNCEQGVSAEPCGQCDTCLAIENGHYVDLIEIDAASRTKVEDTREILDNVQYAPTRGRAKVYLIDEVHMLSRHSFNALLKTLEEPPEHVKFLLATTDPQKLPITILSRCLQFNLKALMRSEIHEHLAYILKAEAIEFEDEAIALLAKAADGSLRDGLSLTDQAIAQAGGALTLATVEGMLGTIDKQWGVKLLANIVNQDATEAMNTVEQIAAFMPDYQHLVDQLLSIFHLAAMTQLVPGAAQIDESLHSFITRLAKKLSPEDLQLFYQILLNGKKDIELAPTARMGFEMLLLRLLAFRPVKVVNRPVGEVVADTLVSAEGGEQELLPVPEPKVEVTSVQSKQIVAPEKPVIAEPQEDKSAPEQLDQQTLYAQQESILAAAEHQGYSPVATSSITATSVTLESTPEPAQNNELELSKTVNSEQVARQESVDDSYSEDQPPYLAMDSARQQERAPQVSQPIPETPDEPEVKQPVAQQVTQYEDPVAAILANRNLSLDDMFGAVEEQHSGPQNVEQAPSPQGGEDSGKKPDNEAVIQSAGPCQQSEPPFYEEALTEQPQPQYEQPVFAQAQQEYQEPVFEQASEPLPAPVTPPEPTETTPEPVASPAEVPPQAPQISQPTEPELPRWAHEVDEWAALIEKMGLGGLVRLLAVQSVWQKNGKEVLLIVQDSEKHLDSPGLRDQITKGLSLALNQPIELELQFTSEFYNTPLNIQRQIDADRLARAKNLIYQDPLVLALQQQFDAQVHDESIQALG